MTVHLAYYGNGPDTAPCNCDGCRAERLEKVVGGLLEAVADFLTDLDDYPDPAPILAPLEELGVDAETRQRGFEELLRLVVERAASPSRFNPFDLTLELEYLTGVRR